MRVHAKAYLILSRRGATLFFGSANGTLPALTRSVDRGGNVEILAASRLDHTATETFTRDLDDLFALARRTFSPTAPSPPQQPAGVILVGELLDTKVGRRLRLEAPTMRRGRVRIASGQGKPGIAVSIRKGIGWIARAPELSLLFPEEAPARTGSSWGAVLWERAGRRSIPFPVCVPLIGVGGATADDALLDLVQEQLGIWPHQTTNRVADADNGADGEDDTSGDDNDLEQLAEAQHEGQLDRLAVFTAILRRRVLASRRGLRSGEGRLKLVADQVARLAIPPYLRRVLLTYLNTPGQPVPRHGK